MQSDMSKKVNATGELVAQQGHFGWHSFSAPLPCSTQG